MLRRGFYDFRPPEFRVSLVFVLDRDHQALTLRSYVSGSALVSRESGYHTLWRWRQQPGPSPFLRQRFAFHSDKTTPLIILHPEVVQDSKVVA
jgi:hypothetical protein